MLYHRDAAEKGERSEDNSRDHGKYQCANYADGKLVSIAVTCVSIAILTRAKDLSFWVRLRNIHADCVCNRIDSHPNLFSILCNGNITPGSSTFAHACSCVHDVHDCSDLPQGSFSLLSSQCKSSCHSCDTEYGFQK